MKKLLIVNNNLHIGGVQKALVSLLWNIREYYEITLLLFYPGGELLEELPPEIRVISPGSGYRYLGMTRQDTKTWQDRLGRSCYASIARIFGRKHATVLMGLGQTELSGYDIAVSYLHNSGRKSFYGGCNEFVLRHVQAKKKIAFLHCDYTLCGADTPENAIQYARFDRIAACSRGCAEAFLGRNPRLRDKVSVVPNCHRFEKIRHAAKAAVVKLPEGGVNIVTVARLGKEKGVERAVRAIAALGPLQEKMHYYIVGDGVLRSEVQAEIEKASLSDCVTLCGMLENPYGYIRSADLLLIPSYSEAAPLVIGEAACLGTPVLTTRTSSADEMVADAGLGWVCENNEQAIMAALADLLEQPERIWEKRNALAELELVNTAAISAFMDCVNAVREY